LAYFDAYNGIANAKTLPAGELASDGYTAAYTEVLSGAGDDLKGPCVCTSGDGCNAFDMTVTGSTSGGDYDSDEASTLGFMGSATADTDIGADSTATGASSLCAKKCSALTHWLVNASNLPYTMEADSGNSNILTTADTAAVAAGTTVMTNSSCIGFEAEINNTSAGNTITCKGYFGGFPAANAALGAASTL
jgi:hypothetical protein